MLIRSWDENSKGVVQSIEGELSLEDTEEGEGAVIVSFTNFPAIVDVHDVDAL